MSLERKGKRKRKRITSIEVDSEEEEKVSGETESKKRPKRQRSDVSERKERRKKDVDTYTIKLGIARFLRDRRLLPRIELWVRVVTQATFEASKLINLHLLRALDIKDGEQDKKDEKRPTLPEINQSWIDRALQLVSGSEGSNASKSTPDKIALEETFQQEYVPCRDKKVGTQTYADIGYMAQVLCEARKLMMINAKNHVTTNFWRRHRQYLLNQVAVLLPRLTLRREQWRVVDQLYAATTTGADDDAVDLVYITVARDPNDGRKKIDVPLLDAEQKACRELVADVRKVLGSELGVLPVTKARLKKKWWRFLPWLHTILRAFEKRLDFRGNKLFTLFPEQEYNCKYVVLSNTTLKDLYKSVSTNEKNKTNDERWQQAFELKKLRLKNVDSSRHFEQRVLTDGLACSVIMARPKQQKEEKQKSKTATDDDPHPPDHHRVGQAVTRAFKPIPDVSTATHRILGLDPGRRTLYMAYDGGECKGEDDDERQVKAERKYKGHGYVKCSNREYWERAGFKRHNAKKATWLKKAANELGEKLVNTPTSKVSTFAAYKTHLEYLLPLMPAALKLHEARRWRRWRWKSYIAKQRTLDMMCRRLIETEHGKDDGKKTIVAFGAAGFSSCSRGHAPGPVKQFKKRLRKYDPRRVTVVDIDEYMTSQVCSACESEHGLVNVHGARQPADPNSKRSKHKKKKKRKKKDVHSKASGGETKKSEAETKATAVSLHAVRVCQNTECRIVWERDRNAARSMRRIFLAMNANEGARPTPFVRGKATRKSKSSNSSASSSSSSNSKKKRTKKKTSTVNVSKNNATIDQTASRRETLTMLMMPADDVTRSACSQLPLRPVQLRRAGWVS